MFLVAMVEAVENGHVIQMSVGHSCRWQQFMRLLVTHMRQGFLSHQDGLHKSPSASQIRDQIAPNFELKLTLPTVTISEV